MKTNVLETSIEAYHGDKMKAASLTKSLIEYSLTQRRFTCKMAAEHLGVDASTLSGIIKNRLMPHTLKREFSKFKCPITGNSASWLYNPDYSTQMDLLQ